MNLRVLHVSPESPGGRLPSFVDEQIQCLSAADINSRVITFGGSASLRNPSRITTALSAIRSGVSGFRPHIVHAHWGSLLAVITARAVGRALPLVVTFRGSDINPVPSERLIWRVPRVGMSQWAASEATQIVCVSSELRDRLWWGREKATVILDGTNLSQFKPGDRNAAREALGWPATGPVVLFNEGGRPSVKRSDLAEQGFLEAKKRVPSLRLQVLNGSVSRDQMPTVLQASDCVMMLSDYEGSPNIVREALACGVPVVSVLVGDVQRWLSGTNGTRLVDRNPVAIGRAVADILESSERPLDISVGAFSDVHSRDALVEVYKRAASRLLSAAS